MKMEIEYYIVLVLFLILFMVTLCKTPTFIPFMEMNHFSKNYDYEGFTNPKSLKAPTHGKKIDGFSGFYDLTENHHKLDKLDNLDGKKTCAPNNLTNKNGFLCMDETHNKLLRTRGGNDVGQPMEI